jgi:predicted component of type VI protein secretion system
MPAQLVALDEGASVLLDKPILLIGRHPECDIQIESRKISRRHCCIAQVADYLVIRDLGSTNGIRINGSRVREGRLDEGDEVVIGASRYKVSWEDEIIGPSATVKADEPVRAAEDDLIESSDEPVPLSEPGKVVHGLPRVPVAEAPRPLAESPRPPAEAPRPISEPTPILPDVLELAPSDIFPGPPPHASDSPSHHSL